jgi:hypothetical protein
MERLTDKNKTAERWTGQKRKGFCLKEGRQTTKIGSSRKPSIEN